MLPYFSSLLLPAFPRQLFHTFPSSHLQKLLLLPQAPLMTLFLISLRQRKQSEEISHVLTLITNSVLYMFQFMTVCTPTQANPSTCALVTPLRSHGQHSCSSISFSFYWIVRMSIQLALMSTTWKQNNPPVSPCRPRENSRECKNYLHKQGVWKN